MEAWRDGPMFFRVLLNLDRELQIGDMCAFLDEHAISSELLPWKPAPFQGMPMRHRGKQIGVLFLTAKQGEAEFGREDREVLHPFAAHAAACVNHACALRDEQRLRAEREAVIESSPIGLAAIGVSDAVSVLLNEEARRIVEILRTPAEPIERLLPTITARFGDGREFTFSDLLVEAPGTIASIRAEEIELSVPDGRRVSVLLNFAPKLGEDGSLASVIATMQDLAALKESERVRAEFLGIVSHELRAPLAVIKGLSATVLEPARTYATSEIEQFFRIINGQVNRMDVMFGDLLDAGRIEAGMLTVSPAPCRVADLVDQARAAFVSGGGRNPVEVDVLPDVPSVMADRERVLQVLGNLLGNASRHSHDSMPIRIEVAPQGTSVAVSVVDEGPGIAPDMVSRLFSKYAVTDASERSTGNGLGLAICKAVVEAHGGRIRAESDGPGRGARFVFTLPAVAGTEAEKSVGDVGPASARSANGKPQRVLVVDDDPETLRLVREVLTRAGYDVLTTGDHDSLERILLAEKPALVLLDLMLPGTDGIKLMQTVPELSDQPVIFLSGYGRDETVAKALEAGADDYIVKPFSPKEMVARVRTALRRCADTNSFATGDLVIDYDRRRVTLAGLSVPLTATEFDLLRELSLHADSVCTHQQLLRRVWRNRRGDGKRIVRAYVNRLRVKLGDDSAAPRLIHTEPRVGYYLRKSIDA